MSDSYNDFVVGICWYNDPSVFRLLDSLPESMQKIVVDGRFKLAEFSEPLSDPILRTEIRKYPRTIIVNAPDLLEPTKRNQYLNWMVGFKYGLMLDSDEFVQEADWSKFAENCRHFDHGIYGVNFTVDSLGGKTVYPRLWVNPSEWRYHKCHNIFFNTRTKETANSGNASLLWWNQPIEGIICGMNDDERDPEYVKSVFQYQEKLIEYESEKRLEFGL